MYILSLDSGFELCAINYGCIITSIKVPDRHGQMDDVVLGFDTLEQYVQDDQSIGCVAGRFANRIAHGRFSLEGKTYQLDTNNRPHHLHGGRQGWGKKLWSVEEIIDAEAIGVRFQLHSPDGDEGYPGNVHAEVNYLLNNDHSLIIEYRAQSDQPTIINLTQHTYFNLNGGKQSILDHELWINAQHLLEVSESMIPTGKMLEVTGTPFNFMSAKRIGKDIHSDHPQMIIGHGYDHCWVLEQNIGSKQLNAMLSDPLSGRMMQVMTTEPGIQIYTANYLRPDINGRGQQYFTPRLGVCMETQHFPDSPNHPAFPSTILYPDQPFRSQTIYRFGLI